MSKILDTKITSVKEITSALLNYADTFSFVIRKGENVLKQVTDLLVSLDHYLIDVKEVTEWAGTVLSWDQAMIYTYHLNNESAYVLYANENYLYDWLLPRLPEDLIFYKKNRPLFVSITHEKEAYFELEDEDRFYLKNKKMI